LLTVSDECLGQLGILEGTSETLPRVTHLNDAQVKLLLQGIQNDSRSNVLTMPRLTVFNGRKAVLELSEQQSFVTGVEMVKGPTRLVPNPKTKNIKTDLKASVLPVVSPDGTEVTMQLAVQLTRTDVPKAAEPIVCHVAGCPVGIGTVAVQLEKGPGPRCSSRHFDTTIKVADGATALLTGWTNHREVRHEVCPPVISQVPYFGQLFRHISYGKERE
jgi:type II secretory pathway component GspD/PulD (secretin)